MVRYFLWYSVYWILLTPEWDGRLSKIKLEQNSSRNKKPNFNKLQLAVCVFWVKAGLFFIHWSYSQYTQVRVAILHNNIVMLWNQKMFLKNIYIFVQFNLKSEYFCSFSKWPFLSQHIPVNDELTIIVSSWLIVSVLRATNFTWAVVAFITRNSK